MSVVFAGYEIEEGTPVIARDGTEVGTVIGEDTGKLLVDIYDVDRNLLLPPEAVSTFDEDFIMVDLTPEWVRNGDWGTNIAQQAVTTGTAEDVARADRLNLSNNGKTVIDIHEEDLVAAKREIAKGLVTIRKRIVLDEQSIDVPVSEERLNVVRTDLDRDADADYAFEEGTYEIELKGEEVELGKKVRVTGQVELDKERVERTETYTGQTRREEIDVEEVDYAGTNRADLASGTTVDDLADDAIDERTITDQPAR